MKFYRAMLVLRERGVAMASCLVRPSVRLSDCDVKVKKFQCNMSANWRCGSLSTIPADRTIRIIVGWFSYIHVGYVNSCDNFVNSHFRRIYDTRIQWIISLLAESTWHTSIVPIHTMYRNLQRHRAVFRAIARLSCSLYIEAIACYVWSTLTLT